MYVFFCIYFLYKAKLFKGLTILGILALIASSCAFDQESDWRYAKTIYDFHARDIDGNDVSLSKYRDHVIIIVNVASHCKLAETNYKQLQALYEKYGESKGLRILAFPSNDFHQEFDNAVDIKEFVKKFNVGFDVFEKIHVNGDNSHPIYKWLKHQEHGEGFLIDAIKWNYTKFLIDRSGHVVDRLSPTTEPNEMESQIEKYFE